MKNLGKVAGFRARNIEAGRWRISAVAVRAPLPAPPQIVSSPVIIVEGSKRSEPLAGAALDVTHLDGAAIGRNGKAADMLTLLASTSSVSATGWGEGREKLFLRGIADSSFTGASPELVGEYWGDQRLTFTAPDPDLRLYDIDHVEILAGPQGTLYGSASMAGVLRIDPAPPVFDRVEGSIWANAEATAHGGVGQDSGVSLNLPVASGHAAIRAVAYEGVEPGYIDDSERNLQDVNRSLVRGGRVALRISLSNHWTLDLSTLAQAIDNRDAPYADAGSALLVRASNFAQPSSNSIWAGNAVVHGQLGGFDIHSTTGIVRQKLGDLFEVHRSAGAPFAASQNERPELFTEDLRISQSKPGWNWVAGISLLHATNREMELYKVGTVPYFDTDLQERTDEITAYGEVTRSVAGILAMTLGLRAQTDRLNSQGLFERDQFFYFLPPTPTHASAHETRLLPSLGASLAIARRTHLFARYERSSRPGGLTVGEQVAAYGSDTMGSLEVGLRRGEPDRDRFAVTIVGAATSWRHVQADLIDDLGLPVVANIGDGHILSLDMRMGWRVTPHLSADVSATLTRSHLNPADAIAAEAGAHRLPNVARDTVAASIDYHGGRGLPIDLEARVRHVGKSFLGIGSELAVAQGNYVTAGLGATLHLGRADVTADLDNLFDSHATAFAIGTPFPVLNEHEVTPLRPRTIRVGMKYLF